MRSGDVWLHPIHLVTSRADAVPVVPIRRFTTQTLEDVQELHSFASELAHTHQGELANVGTPGQDTVNSASAIWRVSLSSSGMMITGECEARVFSQPLSLCFSEVVHVSAGRQQLIAIGRRDDVTEISQSKKKDRRSLAGPFSEVWVLLVEGDEDVLHRVLDAMSALGAIRADFDSIYHLRSNPIGEGGCAEVYRGEPLRPDFKTNLTQTILSETLNRRRPEAIAAKVLKMKPDCHESEIVREEAAFLLAVQAHPNIVAFYGTFIMPAVEVGKPKRWLMALEWCCRGDLHDYMVASLGACQETQAAYILVGLLAALAHTHSCSIVHRDVKAENILIAQDGRPVLSDFGIAARVDDEHAMQKRCGSPGYAAPEILSGEKYGPKVDVFSAGVVLYYVLFTALPFSGPDMPSILRRTVKSNVKFPRSFGRVSSVMKKIVLLLLEKLPEKRVSAESALCLMWSGWCRDSSLPEWLSNRGPPAGAATSGAATEISEVAPLEIAWESIGSARQSYNSDISDIDRQTYQSNCHDRNSSESTRASIGAQSSISGRCTDVGFDDPLLSEDILDNPKWSSQNQRTIEKPTSQNGTRNRLWRKMRKSSNTFVINEAGPPATSVAETAKNIEFSHQPRPPQAPKIGRVFRLFHNTRKPSGDEFQRRGRRFIDLQMPCHDEERSDGFGQEIGGRLDEDRITDPLMSSAGSLDEHRMTDRDSSKERRIESTSATSGLRSLRSIDVESTTGLRSF